MKIYCYEVDTEGFKVSVTPEKSRSVFDYIESVCNRNKVAIFPTLCEPGFDGLTYLHIQFQSEQSVGKVQVILNELSMEGNPTPGVDPYCVVFTRKGEVIPTKYMTATFDTKVKAFTWAREGCPLSHTAKVYHLTAVQVPLEES